MSPPIATRIFATFVLLALGILGGGVAVEIAIRAYLYTTGSFDKVAGIRKVQHVPLSIDVYSAEHWIFDERYGYRYPTNSTEMTKTLVRDGKVVRCVAVDTFNERGNIGTPIRQNYGEAAVKVAIFGSSFLLDPIKTESGWQTWPMVLERKLSDRLGKLVAVVNFARDGYGVAQMISLAAGKVPEWKPDLAIISFITNDLIRMRLWRTTMFVDGHWHYMVSPYPDPSPDPLVSYDMVMFNPNATREWCLDLKENFRADDPLFMEILEAFEVATRRTEGSWQSALFFAMRLDHSYVLTKLGTGDPYFGIYPQRFSAIQVDAFGDEDRLREEAEILKETGVPLVLFHMARDAELIQETEMIAKGKAVGLYKSLPDLFGVSVRRTTDYIEFPINDPEGLRKSEQNGHPSLRGQDFYAEVVADMLIKEGYLPLDE